LKSERDYVFYIRNKNIISKASGKIESNVLTLVSITKVILSIQTPIAGATTDPRINKNEIIDL
jgi:hypothetical protein